jgi:threonine dehydrogenase-like Zn-dependent dehydrogenase
MKAISVFPDKKEVRLIDHPEPVIESPSQVKLKILDVGICGTDKEIVAFQYGTPPAGSEYLVIGHESLGEVIEVGSAVNDLKVGDIVVTTVRRPCGKPECAACAAGRQDFCYTGEFTERGIKQQHGFMAEFTVDDAHYMNPLPAHLRGVGVLAEPLTIAEKGIAQVREVQLRLPWSGTHQAVVLGAGPVGLLGAMALRVAGFDVWVYSKATPGDHRQEVTEAIGAKFLDADKTAIPDIVSELGGTLDVVYEAIGASKLAFDFLQALGPNGVFVFTGVPGRKAPVEIDTDLLMRNLVLKNQIVLGTVNAPKESFQAAIADLAIFNERWPDALATLITNRFPVDRALEPLSGKVPGIKNVVSFSA